MKRQPKKSGETLLEVIVAVSILILMVTTSSALFYNSANHRNTARNDMAAALLAEDGIETLINFRDTIFLRFSPKADICWNTRPDHANLDDCELDTNKIAAGPYSLTEDASGKHLELAATALTAALANITPPADSDNFYLVQIGTTRFYREIAISYTADGDMYVKARVAYRAGSRVRNVKRDIILTNVQS